jgi:hypothetical protein
LASPSSAVLLFREEEPPILEPALRAIISLAGRPARNKPAISFIGSSMCLKKVL